jgi:outer membrane protein assembly factor BamB
MSRTLKILLMTALIAPAFVLGACSDDDDKPPLPGERISVIELQRDLQPDAPTADANAVLPPLPNAWQNDYWPQAGGYPNHVMQHPALGTSLKKVWSTSIGDGSRRALPLTAQPVVFDGRVYTIDTENFVQATDVKTGKSIWRTNTKPKGEDEDVIGGGVAFAGGKLYVISGFNDLLVLDPATGKIDKVVPLPSAARAAPTVIDDRVFVTTLDNRLLAFQATDGAKLWEYQGLSGDTGLVKQPSAGANRDIVVPVFSSGEVYALRVENGSVAWTENLSAVTQVGGIQSISAISGMPVLDTGLVIAASYGGGLAAIDERTGQKIWQREIGSAETPWVAGDWLYVLSTNGEVVGLHKLTGMIAWVNPLPSKVDEEPVQYAGPVLAGGRLYIVNTLGHLLVLEPTTGKVLQTVELGDPVKLAPVVAGNTLYILTEKGQLLAYR